MTDELKPCPFCGGEAASIEDGGHSTAWEIVCYNRQCAAEPSVWEPSKKMAIAAWNTRADIATPLDDPRVVALVDALRAKTIMDPKNSNRTWLDDQARAALLALEENK